MTKTLHSSAGYSISEAGLPQLHIDNAIATVSLDRPEQHNRIEPSDLHCLADYFQQINRNRSIRVLILTAHGESFSSGYHLGALQGNAKTAKDHEPSLFAQVVEQLERLRPPTICALNGSVYGGATDLALACDFRLGVRGMSLLMPAAKLGIHYYAGGLRRYVERLGLANAQRLFLTAQRVIDKELLAMGYLSELLEPGQLMSRVQELAFTLAQNAPHALQSMKYHLNAIARGEFDADAIDYAHQASVRSAGAQEGLNAWREKRPPCFDDD